MGIVEAIQRVMRELPAEARVNKKRPARVDKVARPAPFKPFVMKTKAVGITGAPKAGATELEKHGWYRLTDSFVVEQPRANVWRFLADLPRIASCMPGARLTESDGHNLKGEMRVVFGPIRASFAGVATSKRDDANFAGVLEGGGSDAKSASRVKGQVSYRLVEIDGNTRIELALEYHVQGSLAQFGRSGLVKDFSRRLIAEFARNLADELAGQRRDNKPSELRAGGLIWSVLWSRIKGLFGSKTP
jgi:carbon-monoxide dehydrogenase small subunit